MITITSENYPNLWRVNEIVAKTFGIEADPIETKLDESALVAAESELSSLPEHTINVLAGLVEDEEVLEEFEDTELDEVLVQLFG